MDKLFKFLKSFGLTDQEIQKVFKDLPVNPEGFAGTNVAKGIFEKGGKKSSAQNPLIAETMISPFKLDKYKGLSKEQTLKKAEEAINFLDKELTKTSNLLVNENLQLSPEQKINFANNLRMKREFEKELEIFKTKPETPVVDIKTKEKIEDVEKLREEAGQVNRPGTLMGDIESRVNKLKTLSKDQGITLDDIVQDAGKAQTSMVNQQREGLVRSTARQILYSDIKSGKLKAPKEVQDIVSGKASGDPIDSFRTIYGEDALEQLDSLTPELGQLRTEIDAEKLARSKFEFTPKLNRPKESYTTEEMEKILKDKDPEEFAKGGSAGIGYLIGMERTNLEKGSIPKEDDEPSEEFIKSMEAGRFKYSFDVQGPDSRIKKSGLPGRTNPKDYGLGITYLPNPSNETAPEIRVGTSRRGAGIEIRKKFKDGGLDYLMGE